MDVIKGWIGFDRGKGCVVFPPSGIQLPLDHILGRAMIGDNADVEVRIVDHLVVIKKDGVGIPLADKLAVLFGDEDGQKPAEPVRATLLSAEMTVLGAPDKTSLLNVVPAGLHQVELYRLPDGNGFVVLLEDTPPQTEPKP